MVYLSYVQAFTRTGKLAKRKRMYRSLSMSNKLNKSWDTARVEAHGQETGKI